MHYQIKRMGERVIFMPDPQLQEALKWKLKQLRYNALLKNYSPISAFGKTGGLKDLLLRHRGGRFFILIDFVHAFHQITREMLINKIPAIAEKRFDICFADLGGKNVLPIGFATSNYLFEVFLIDIDKKLVAWQQKHRGMVTRYADNVLVTWRKNVPEALVELRQIFTGTEVRFTPSMPRKWTEPIRFCGVTLPRKGVPGLSKTKQSAIIKKALKGSIASLEGARRFIDEWDMLRYTHR